MGDRALQRILERAQQRARRLELELSLVLENLSRGERVCLDEGKVHSSASTIKIPLMMAVFEEEGKDFSFQDKMELIPENAVAFSVVTEIGEKFYTIEEYLQWMMLESCNASTNQLIDLVGFEKVNQMVASLGLSETTLQRKMMDFEARVAGRDNFTSAGDMALLMKNLYHGSYLGEEKSKIALDLMKKCRDHRLLLRYLPDPPDFAHKSGGLGNVSHDVGIFFGKNHYLVSAMITNQADEEGHIHRTSTLGKIGRWLFEEKQ